MLRTSLSSLLLCLIWLTPGCKSFKTIDEIAMAPKGKVSLREFRQLLANFGARFSLVVADTTSQVGRESNSSNIGRKALLLKMRTIPLINDAIYSENAFEAGLTAWRICAQLRYHFSEGKGAEAFGEQQDQIIEMATQLEQDIVAIIRRAATEEEMQKARAQMNQWVRANPLPGELALGRSHGGVSKSGDQIDFISQIFKAPLAPLKALEGLSEVATAVHEISVTGRLATETVQHLPTQLRWNSELLLYEIEEQPSVRSALKSMREVSASAASIAATAKDLLPRLRKTIDEVVGDLEQRRPIVTETLADVRKTIGKAQKIADSTSKTVEQVKSTISDVDQTIKDAKPTLEVARSTANSVGQAGQAWTATVKAVGGLLEQQKPATPPSTPAHPFDIREYGQSADSLANAAVKARELVLTSRELIESAKVTDRIEQVDRTTKGLIDHIAWRLGQLIAFWLALLLLYKALVGRLFKPTREAADV